MSALDRVRAAFAAPEPPRGGEPPGASGVLVLVVERPEPAILFTRRSESLSSHPGEISFPGGRVDPTDAGPLAAALRETDEEIGVAPSEVAVLGHLTDFVTFRGTLVCAYVAQLNRDPPSQPRSPDEVAEILVVPIAKLLDEKTYEGRAVPAHVRGDERVVHYWKIAPKTTIWGITGELLSRFLTRVYGWTPPAPAREIERMEDFLP